VKKVTGFYPRSSVDTTGASVVSNAGATLLIETIRAVGHVYGGRTAIALQTSERHPALVPPADAPRSARRESILYWAAAGMVVSMIPVACEHRHRHCPSAARM
jgi:hypothetical protein